MRRHPSGTTFRKRLQGFARKVLTQELELLLFAAMLLVVLYCVCAPGMKPQTPWVNRVETARQLWLEEIHALSTGAAEEYVHGFPGHMDSLESEPGSAQARWQATGNPLPPEFFSKSASRKPQPLHDPDTADRPAESARAMASPHPPSRP